MGEAHARLGPSNHRWPNCPGSVREEAVYEDVAGAAAIDGTGSHLLLELCLQNGVRAEAYDGHVIGANHHDQPMGWLIGPDRIERVQMCLDYITRRVKELRDLYPGSTVKVEAESKADPGGMFGRKDWWGTVDITIMVINAHERCLFMEIIDYKDGRGWVHVKDNTQLLSYAAGKLRPFVASGPDRVRPFKPEQVAGGCRLTIVQPKTDKPIRSEDETAVYVMEKAEELARAARATDDPGAPLIPDDKGGKGYCRWCKHKPNCTAHEERSVEMVMSMSNDIVASDGQSLFELVNQVITDVKNMDNEKLAQLADAKDGLMAAFDKVEKEIEERVVNGQQVPGYAMRPGKCSNVWALSEEEVVKKLRARKLKLDDIYPKKLAAPAQILKSDKLTKDQKKRLEEELIVQKAGADKLTKVARAAKPSAEQMFGDVIDFTAPTNNVGQSGTQALESPKSLFDDAPAESTEPQPQEEISFF